MSRRSTRALPYLDKCRHCGWDFTRHLLPDGKSHGECARQECITDRAEHLHTGRRKRSFAEPPGVDAWLVPPRRRVSAVAPTPPKVKPRSSVAPTPPKTHRTLDDDGLFFLPGEAMGCASVRDLSYGMFSASLQDLPPTQATAASTSRDRSRSRQGCCRSAGMPHRGGPCAENRTVQVVRKDDM